MGNPCWLEMVVATDGGGTLTMLAPGQALLPPRCAHWAANAGQGVAISGTVRASSLDGLQSIPVHFNKLDNRFPGNGAGLSNVYAAQPGGRSAAQLWQTGGNSSTTPDANFLGTTDNQRMELKVKNQHAFRLEPNSSSPNVVAGLRANTVTKGNHRAVIAGAVSAAYPN